MFPGDSEIDQIYRIFQYMGTPDNIVWPGCTQLPDFKSSFPKWEPKSLPIAIVRHKADDLFKVKSLCFLLSSYSLFFVLQKLMTYDPNKRVSAKNAMNHPYFDNVELVPNVALPSQSP